MSFLTVHLPSKGEILVSEGQEVKTGDLLARGAKSEKRSLNLPRLLKVKPQKVKNYLAKKLGDEVKEGEVIAQKTSLFSKRKIKSPQTGILESFDGESGILTIKTLDDSFALKAKVSGKIKKIEEDGEIVIEFKGIEIEADKGVGPQTQGQIVVFKKPQVTLSDLNPDLAEKILAGKIWGCGSLNKAKALGVVAVLAEEVEEGDCFEKDGESAFSLLIFSPFNFEKVLKYDGSCAGAWGEEKSLIIDEKQS